MNHLDDNELIDGLRAGLSHRTADVHAPDGLADDARRLARRRATTRAIGAGVPALAVAGVATVLVAGSGGPAAHSTIAPTAPGANAPVAHLQDTAYIIKRVKAKVADVSQSGTTIHSSMYGSSVENADGSLVLGAKYEDDYDYTAPDGTESYRQTYYQNDGSPRVIVFNTLSPNGNDAGTIINPVEHTYSQTQASGASESKGPTPNLESSASQVQQALQNGQVTQLGTTTVNGTQAIALSVKFTEPSGATPTGLTLYVDAQTYQPLRTVTAVLVPNDHNLSVSDWVPATAGNIAQAQDNSIPAGYTKVANAIAG